MTKVFDLRQTDDPSDIIHRTVQALTEGQVVALPTDTVYGLAAHALDDAAVDKIIEIKGGETRRWRFRCEAGRLRKIFFARPLLSQGG